MSNLLDFALSIKNLQDDEIEKINTILSCGEAGVSLVKNPVAAPEATRAVLQPNIVEATADEGGNPTCPQGYYYDPATKQCILNVGS